MAGYSSLEGEMLPGVRGGESMEYHCTSKKNTQSGSIEITLIKKRGFVRAIGGLIFRF